MTLSNKTPAGSAAITLFGATGYTGNLIAHELTAQGLDFRIAGRSEDKLRELSESLPGKPDWITADAAKGSSLPALFNGTRLLINCAGPFTDLGERVIAQAALGGVHYLDITNELGYVFKARSYGQMAKRTGAALVPACGFEVAFADCLAALLCSAADQLQTVPSDVVNVVYALSGKGASAGTRRSAVRSLATSWIAFRAGEWTGQIPGGQVKQFPLPGGTRYALAFPSCESITIPAHNPTQQVGTWMTTTPGARFWAPVFIPLFARLSRSILRGAFLKMAGHGGFTASSAMDENLRTDSPFTIYVEAIRQLMIERATLQGQDPYGLTAKLIAYAAREMTKEGYSRSGLLAPAQAFDPQAFLQYGQEHWGLTLQIRDTAARPAVR